ncbi:YibE/F family protein [Propioniciclava soli]|uniref:YibE/F family protein n=1 Tax=Propioniciclava soli TaxID=2775081 RepID=A0ABZ3C646_9ACTN
MGPGHNHDHAALDADVRVSQTARRVTVVALCLVAVVTLVGLVWLWPTERATLPGGSTLAAEGIEVVPGRVTALAPCADSAPDAGVQHACEVATVEVLEGADAGASVPVELIGVSARSGITVGDRLQVAAVPGAAGEPTYSLITVDRMGVIVVFGALFVVAVLAVAGWKGLRGLVGLVISGWVLFAFVIPALAAGEAAVPVALVGSTAIMFVVLYVAHGVSMRTSSAFVGTLLSLVATTALGAAGVWAARLSGISTDETITLANLLGDLDFPDILTCSLVIAGLRVLNDVTITQASAVWEIRAAGPHLVRRELFASGMRIGRDHIASTIYTIVFAYAGAALSLLLVLSLYDQPLHLLLSTEQFAEEIIRTLGSGIGLVLSVPLTTAVAALTVRGAQDAVQPARAR